jgi:hypothetical protein
MAEAALKREYVYAGAAEEAASSGYVAEPRQGALTREAARPMVSLFSVLGTAFIAALAAACILSRIELTRISADITGARTMRADIREKAGVTEAGITGKLNERREENSALRVEYERAFDLKEIERYAIEELGMVRAQNAASRGADMTPSDKAVIPASAKNPGGFMGFIEGLLEYFK